MAKEASIWPKIGVWSYIAGLIIAALVGIFSATGWGSMTSTTVLVLAALGLIVGLLNVGDSEVTQFLLASIAFVLASLAMNQVFGALEGSVWTALEVFTSAIVVFTAPGALVVSFKALYNVAKDQ